MSLMRCSDVRISSLALWATPPPPPMPGGGPAAEAAEAPFCCCCCCCCCGTGCAAAAMVAAPEVTEAEGSTTVIQRSERPGDGLEDNEFWVGVASAKVGGTRSEEVGEERVRLQEQFRHRQNSQKWPPRLL